MKEEEIKLILKEIRELRLENKRLEDIIKGLRLEILYIKNSGNIYS